MAISREDVLRVAELAHLELKPEEIEMYRGQLDEILNYIGKLQTLDVTNVESMSQVIQQDIAGRANLTSSISNGMAMPNSAEEHPELREDTIRPCSVADAVLSQAPDAAKPFFRVPKVIER